MIKAELIQSMGSDLTVVNSARVSFSKESAWTYPTVPADMSSKLELVLSAADSKLLRYLAKHNHFTPFTHCMITLRETVPIFVARQRFKHTIGFSYNEVSRRYVDDTPEFFVPTAWRRRPEGSVKQGSGGAHSKQETLSALYFQQMEMCAELYKYMLDEGVAPEQARMCLPQSMFTSYYVTGSLMAFARAYKLRIDPHAQIEIQDLALQWDACIRPLFPESWAALTA
jgi:thymidylate synthase (FAD)